MRAYNRGMGGYGSGRKFGFVKRTVEDCCSIDATRWQREGMFRPSVGPYRSPWVWSDPNSKQELVCVGYKSDCSDTVGSVGLDYYVSCESDASPLEYTVRLTATKTPWGKLRWWFICPLAVKGGACGRRVRKLYLPRGGVYFGCRHCHNLTYTSCQESHKYDACLAAIGAPVGLSAREVGKLLKQAKW